MHVLSFLTQASTKYGIRIRLVAQIRTLPIYTSRSYDQGFITCLRGQCSCRQTKTTRERDINIHFWTLRASTHERPPCVLRHTGNAYAVSHIFTHTLPSTIETAPKRSTLNGQRCIRHNDVFTSRTLAIRDIQGQTCLKGHGHGQPHDRFTSRNIDLRNDRDHNHTVRNPHSISGGRQRQTRLN